MNSSRSDRTTRSALVTICCVVAIGCDTGTSGSFPHQQRWELNDRLVIEVRNIESRMGEELDRADVARLIEILHFTYFPAEEGPNPSVRAWREAQSALIRNGRGSLPALLGVLKESQRDVVEILHESLGAPVVSDANMKRHYHELAQEHAIDCAAAILGEPIDQRRLPRAQRQEIVDGWIERIESELTSGK
jgi:hypothetical protein